MFSVIVLKLILVYSEKMADEEMERDSPESPSEATPPYGDESPELVDQPSPPEEQRVSSSTDVLPLDISDSSEQERQDFLHYASPTPELAERIRLLLETSRIFFASMQSMIIFILIYKIVGI